MTDAEWHDVRVEYDAASGEIAADVDGASEPLMTATDTHVRRAGASASARSTTSVVPGTSAWSAQKKKTRGAPETPWAAAAEPGDQRGLPPTVPRRPGQQLCYQPPHHSRDAPCEKHLLVGLREPRPPWLAATLTPLTASTTAAADPAGRTSDPPDRSPSTLGLVLEEYAQLPASTPNGPWTDVRIGTRHNRITHLDEVPDGSGRLAVPDMNENLYLVRETASTSRTSTSRAGSSNFHTTPGSARASASSSSTRSSRRTASSTPSHRGRHPLTEDTPDFPGFGNTASTASSPSGRPRTRPRRSSRARAARSCGAVRRARAHRPADRLQPDVPAGDDDSGILYVLVGDGGNGVGNGNPRTSRPRRARSCASTRWDDSANGEYGIPTDNPFLGTPGALPEIYAVGMRDPHRISWDPEGDHDMYLGHIGEWQVESVYAVEPATTSAGPARGPVPGRTTGRSSTHAGGRRRERLHLPRGGVRPQPRPRPDR